MLLTIVLRKPFVCDERDSAMKIAIGFCTTVLNCLLCARNPHNTVPNAVWSCTSLNMRGMLMSKVGLELNDNGQLFNLSNEKEAY